MFPIGSLFVIICVGVVTICAINSVSKSIVKDGLRQFPYQAGLKFIKSWWIIAEKSHWCSGSVISTNWVLTTADCCQGMDSVIIYLGSNVRAEDYSVKSDIFITHENYSKGHEGNNIGLIKTENLPLTIDGNIQSIRLLESETNMQLDGSSCTLSGWKSSYGESDNLLYTTVTVSESLNCFMGNDQYGDEVLCAFANTSVRKDDGSPLACYFNDSLVLVGIFKYEYMRRCLFNRVTHYLDWIKDKTSG